MDLFPGRFLAGCCAVFLAAAPVFAQRPPDLSDRFQQAESLYAQRSDPKKLDEAIGVWKDILRQDPKNFDAAWKLAMAYYFKGSHAADKDQKKAIFLAGVQFAQMAKDDQPERAEGWYWLGVLNGVYAREKGVWKSISMLGPIRREFERAAQLDPSVNRGGPDRALGRYYYEVPGILGGDKEKSLEHLKRSLAYNEHETLTHLFLGDTYAALGSYVDARREYQAVLDAPVDPYWATEDAENKAKAAAALKKIQDK